MKIAVDAMGGDYGPEAIVHGSIQARRQLEHDIVLVGNGSQLRGILDRQGPRSAMEVIHAPDAIGMDEAGPVAIRRKRESSLGIAVRMLADGQVDAVVSAGNTSAIVAAAKFFVGLNSGLRRPALAVPLPTPNGRVLLVDAGAHSDADTIHLAHSAALAHVYLEVAERVTNPRVGLLNIGHEPQKGKKSVRRAFSLLSRSGLNFVGNVEPQDLFRDRTDVVICDGFVGNILLKMVEGLAESLLHFFESRSDELPPSARGDLYGLIHHFRDHYHYQSVGGAPLLGSRKVIVIAHGRSQPGAVANAIRLAAWLVGSGIYERMGEVLDQKQIFAELKHQFTLLMLDRLRGKWSFGGKR